MINKLRYKLKLYDPITIYDILILNHLVQEGNELILYIDDRDSFEDNPNICDVYRKIDILNSFGVTPKIIKYSQYDDICRVYLNRLITDKYTEIKLLRYIKENVIFRCVKDRQMLLRKYSSDIRVTLKYEDLNSYDNTTEDSSENTSSCDLSRDSNNSKINLSPNGLSLFNLIYNIL